MKTDFKDNFVVIIKKEIENNKSNVEMVKLSRLKKFSKGLMVGKAPIGYKFNRKKKIMEIKLKEANIVKEIYKLKSEGKSITYIANMVNMGYQSVKNILTNKVYIGIISFGNQERQGIHPHLIPRELFEKCQN